MRVVLDTNILVRLAILDDPQNRTAGLAVSSLRAAGRELRLLPQSVYEFRVVATRAVDANGRGLTVADADRLIDTFDASFPLLPDPDSLFGRWRELVK